MTVNSTSDRVQYQGDGATTQWTIPFSFPDADDIQVFITTGTTVTQLLASQYTITPNPPVGANPTPTGGIVVYPLTGPALAIGSSITIVRHLLQTQSVSLSNQSIIYPPVIEAEFDYLTMLDQTGSSNISRAFQVGLVDPIPALVPPVAVRANQGAFFDSQGNLVPGLAPAGGAFISAAMQPVVAAATLAIARQLMGIAIPTTRVGGPYTVTNSNNRQIIELNGSAFYTVTFPAPTSGFDNTFWTILVNIDNRGKFISISGVGGFMLWPGQWVWVLNDAGGAQWIFFPQPQRWVSPTQQNFYVDPVNGSDSNDGLAPGTGAFQTIQQAVNIVQAYCDGPFVINLANGTHQVGNGLVISHQTVGQSGVVIVGNSSNPYAVIITATPAGSWTVQANYASTLNISGVTLEQAVGSGGALLTAINNSVIYMSNCVFGPTSPDAYHMFACFGGVIRVIGGYHVQSNNYGFHAVAEDMGVISYQGTFTVNIDVAATINTFLSCKALGFIDFFFGAPTFTPTNTTSGAQAAANYNSIIRGNGVVVPGSGVSTGNGAWIVP